LSAHPVLLLGITDDGVKAAFEILNFIIDQFDLLVFRFLENCLFHFHIDLLDLVDKLDSSFSDILDLLEKAANLRILAFHVLGQYSDAL